MSKRKKRTSGNSAKRTASFGDRVVLRDYEAWVRRDDPEVDETDIDGDLAQLEDLFAFAHAHRVDLHDPRTAARLCGLITDEGVPDADATRLLVTFDEYIHFRLDAGVDAAGWTRAHDLIQDEIDGRMDDDLAASAVIAVIADAIEASESLPEHQRRDALGSLPIVSGVRELLTWVGKSRPITDTGAVRRADIATVAAMIGIDAVGVAKRTAQEDPDAPVQVSTMWELGPLGAWWEVLRVAGVIETTATRVYPGETAGERYIEGGPALESADKVAAMFVMEALTNRLRGDEGDFGERAFARTMSWMLTVLAGETELAGGVDDAAGDDAFDDEVVEPYLEFTARRTLDDLAARGLLIVSGDTYAVPDALAGTVARGVAMAAALAPTLIEAADEGYGLYDDEDDGPYADDEGNGPFDDPEVRALMAQHGIVHRPGLAQKTLNALAPLLAEEGIDLDNLDESDVDRLDGALQRAQERANLLLFTPIGDARERAITVLRLLSEALTEGSDAVARVVLEGIPSDPDQTRPSVAQVIGVGLGFLDTWHGASAFGAGVARKRLASWDEAAVAAARDILAAAGKGEAFDSLGRLIATHRGKAVLEGAALAVAASVAVQAGRDGTELPATAEQMLDS